MLENVKNEILFSAVSAWEIVTKARAGRLTLPRAPAELVAAEIAENDFRILPVELSHALAVADLPLYHEDPFDRLLIAQAAAEDVRLITRDPKFSPYPITLYW